MRWNQEATRNHRPTRNRSVMLIAAFALIPAACKNSAPRRKANATISSATSSGDTAQDPPILTARRFPALWPQ